MRVCIKLSIALLVAMTSAEFSTIQTIAKESLSGTRAAAFYYCANKVACPGGAPCVKNDCTLHVSGNCTVSGGADGGAANTGMVGGCWVTWEPWLGCTSNSYICPWMFSPGGCDANCSAKPCAAGNPPMGCNS